MSQDPIVETLRAAGCVFPADEAHAMRRACDGNDDRLTSFVDRRVRGEPLPWIIGSVEFAGQRLHIAPGVYVPRPQTELLAARAVERLPESGTALDLCTGCGAIAAVLQAAHPAAHVHATERDPAAAACARSNGVRVHEGHLDEGVPVELEGRVDVLCAVVPYVPTSELELLPRDVQAYEPVAALDGGSDGTTLLAEVIRRSVRWLDARGTLLLELGGSQATLLAPILHEFGYRHAELIVDDASDVRGIQARFG